MLVPMNRQSSAGLVAGLLLLGAAAWLVPSPRLRPRPAWPEIAPFSAGERIALVLPDPENFPPPESLGLVRRARAAGAEVRVFAPGEAVAAYAPDRLYQPFPWPYAPGGYHPDQWPALPPNETYSGHAWQMLVLTPDEIAARNQAVLAAARAFRAAGDAAREADMLSRARRGEIYLPLKNSAPAPRGTEAPARKPFPFYYSE